MLPEDMPESMRSSIPDFAYRPQFRASNDHFMLYLAEQSLTVGVVGTYPGWDKFSSVIQQVFAEIKALSVFNEIQRIGLRYVSFFDGNALAGLKLLLQLPGYNGSQLPSSVLMRLPATGCEHTLQVANFIDYSQASGQPSETERLGTVVDIDTMPQQAVVDFFERPFYWLNLLHEAEKTLFYGLLTDDFLRTLNPEY